MTGLLKGAPRSRLIVIGGAGSLYVDEEQTTRLVDTPEFPEPYLARHVNERFTVVSEAE